MGVCIQEKYITTIKQDSSSLLINREFTRTDSEMGCKGKMKVDQFVVKQQKSRSREKLIN